MIHQLHLPRDPWPRPLASAAATHPSTLPLRLRAPVTVLGPFYGALIIRSTISIYKLSVGIVGNMKVICV